MGPNDEALFALTHDESIEEFIRREIKEGIQKELSDRDAIKRRANSPLAMVSNFNSLPDEERAKQWNHATPSKDKHCHTLPKLTEKEKFDNQCSANMRDYLRGK